MALYLDIAAVRIQAYLARTTDLKGRRGASALLAEKTSDGFVNGILDGRARINTAGGHADGTIHLEMLAPHDTEAGAQDVAREVLGALREALPGAEFQAVWAEGSDYLRAFRDQMRDKIDTGDVIESVPPVHEIPLARLCELTGADPATDLADVGARDNLRSVCVGVDAKTRLEAADRRSAQRRAGGVTGLAAEERLADDLGFPRIADDFEDLARLARHKRNHLATVFLDGNAVGQFFAAVADADTPEHVKEELSTSLTDATWAALRAGTEAVRRDPHVAETSKLPVMPHVVGGDDVLISMPATRAWAFVRTYLDTFGQETRSAAQETVPALHGRAPTTSAGVVFSHASYPFQRCVKVADDLLATAKRTRRGEPAVLWVDITREGELWPKTRRAWSLDEISDAASDLTATAGLDASTKASLEQALATESDELAIARVKRLARRLRITNAVAPFVEEPDALRDALDIARWWKEPF